MDIWTPIALPALQLHIPRLKKVAGIITGNTISAANMYKDDLAVIKGEGSKFKSVKLPLKGGLEYTVYEG